MDNNPKSAGAGKIVMYVILIIALALFGRMMSAWECDRCGEKVRGTKHKIVNTHQTICDDCYDWLKMIGAVEDL